MRINNISSSYQHKYNASFSSFCKNEIKKENGYVMIPEKKYERDKWFERGFFVLLLLIELFRGSNNKPPKL